MTVEIRIMNLKSRPGFDVASCFVDGARYEAVSRSGAEHALCRILRNAGIPDQPWLANGGSMSGPSIYSMADLTIRDDDRGCRVVEFRPFPVNGGAKKGGADENG